MGGPQFGTPTKEEDQSRTRSVGTADNQSAVGQDGQANKDQSSGRVTGQNTSSNRAGSTAEGQSASGQNSSGKKSSSSILKGLISGTMISDSLILKDIRYSALIFILGIIFIANRFNAERVEREITVLEQEVRDMRAEALSVSAELGSVSRQSEITDLVKERGLGLEELREPPYRIVVNE